MEEQSQEQQVEHQNIVEEREQLIAKISKDAGGQDAQGEADTALRRMGIGRLRVLDRRIRTIKVEITRELGKQAAAWLLAGGLLGLLSGGYIKYRSKSKDRSDR